MLPAFKCTVTTASLSATRRRTLRRASRWASCPEGRSTSCTSSPSWHLDLEYSSVTKFCAGSTLTGKRQSCACSNSCSTTSAPRSSTCPSTSPRWRSWRSRPFLCMMADLLRKARAARCSSRPRREKRASTSNSRKRSPRTREAETCSTPLRAAFPFSHSSDANVGDLPHLAAWLRAACTPSACSSRRRVSQHGWQTPARDL
mmetsp:Transcript_24172/g.50684  ORF Transcript_24172/g.50684 Transcript_24172/m.50684 type:complete len:202 (+) Transcript_24172:125-730(+)